jgi:cytochrome P450
MPMTESDVIDEVLSLMSTGHETITEWMTWSWVILAKHPEFEGAWRAEIAGLGASANWIGAATSLAPLTYGLLEETLRLYPPTWLYGRVPLVADVLPSGLAVSPSDNVLLCPYLMHRHPGAFPDPERFNPMRYEASDWGQHAGRTLIPFGAGAHRCIGDKFSRMETMLALVSLARVVRFERLANAPIVPDPRLTLGVQGGFPVRIRLMHSDAT